jgi:hypothetical protein
MSTSTKTVTVACPACKAVNRDAEVNSKCSACGEPLAAAVLQHSIDELKRINERMAEASAPSFKSFNGFGTTLLDYRALPDGHYEATRWVVALMLPLVPLATYVIEPQTQEHSYGRETSKFNILKQGKLSAARVVRTYLLAVVALLPLVLGFLNSAWVNHALGGPLAAFAMFASFAWAIYIVMFRIKNEGKAYRSKPAR